MTSTLIQTVDGQETPAPGRWTIAPGYPVDSRAGRWWHRSTSTLRTRSGYLLVAADERMSLQIVLDATPLRRPGLASLTYQSFSILQTLTPGLWAVDGELVSGGHVIPARSVLQYHGVFRTGRTVIARLGWRLPHQRGQNHIPPGFVRLSAAADVNAEAPPTLTNPKVWTS